MKIIKTFKKYGIIGVLIKTLKKFVYLFCRLFNKAYNFTERLDRKWTNVITEKQNEERKKRLEEEYKYIEWLCQNKKYYS